MGELNVLEWDTDGVVRNLIEAQSERAGTTINDYLHLSRKRKPRARGHARTD